MLLPLVAVLGGDSVPAREGVLLTMLMTDAQASSHSAGVAFREPKLFFRRGNVQLYIFTLTDKRLQKNQRRLRNGARRSNPHPVPTVHGIELAFGAAVPQKSMRIYIQRAMSAAKAHA